MVRSFSYLRTETHQNAGTRNNIVQLDQGQLPWSQEQTFIKHPVCANSVLRRSTGDRARSSDQGIQCRWEMGRHWFKAANFITL